MEEKRNVSWNNDIHTYTIMKDILRNWVAILLITVSAGLGTQLFLESRHQPQYVSKATIVVTNAGVNSNVYSNLYSASSTAAVFTQILNSNIMKNMVAKDVGIEEFEGTATAVNLEDTNLLELSVTADSPMICFLEIKSVLKNYRTISRDLMGDIQLTLLEAPKAPESPSNPPDTLKSIVVIMGAVFSALLFILSFQSVSRNTIRVPKDVSSKLDIDLLETLYHEKKNRNPFLQIKNRREKTSILITNPLTSFRYSENIRKLAGRIINRMKESRDAKTLLVCSVLENEGKSTVAANVVIAMADMGYKVLLIDADFRKPSQYKVLNMKETDFISLNTYFKEANDLTDLSSVTKKVPAVPVECILNRNPDTGNGEMFSVDKMAGLLEQCRQEYDYIVIDTSPMQLAADAEALAFLCDNVLLVIRQHLAEAADLNEAIIALNGSGDKVIGAVLNDVYSSRNVLSLGTYDSYGTGYGKYGKYGYGYGGRYEQK